MSEREKWIEAYARRFANISGVTMNEAYQVANACWDEDGGETTPESAAEDEWSYWTDDR